MSPSNVVKLQIPPKSNTVPYKRVPITVTYYPSTGKWGWKIEIVTTSTYGEYSDSERNAFRDAKKYIDKQGLGK